MKATIFQHRSSPITFDRRDPPLADDPYPPLAACERAKAEQLCARADILDELPDEASRNLVLKLMDKPSYVQLQAMDALYVQTMADDAAMLLYAQPLDRLTPMLRATLLTNAAVFLRSRHQAWVSYAKDMAVMAIEGLLREDLKAALPHLTESHWHGHAVRCVDRAYGAMRSALASTEGMAPGTYLRLAGKSKAEDAR